ncbi:MAG: tetratricopeptide repeat protein [Ignavibacterium sp.]|nr:MAG: tetratricopeptide repeat protein [Ignavibacterium sp.]
MTKVNSLNISLQQLELNKIDKLFYNTKGVKKADEGKFKEASECFTKAIELMPNDSMSYFNRATVKMNIGDLQGARSDFKLSVSFRLSSIR